MTAWSGAGVRRKPTSSVESSGGRVLLEQGDCQTRVMPASTFKIALAITGFDSGFLPDPHAPVLSCKPADPDRGGDSRRTRHTGSCTPSLGTRVASPLRWAGRA
jgi:hypothetical protein